jgi:hypothetical protein
VVVVVEVVEVVEVVVVAIQLPDQSGYAEMHLHVPLIHSKYLSTRQLKSTLQFTFIICCGRQDNVAKS